MTKHPKFKSTFAKYICENDSITVDHNGITYTARIVRDDDASSPDKRQDGFWPSLDPKDAGYIGPKSKRSLARGMQRAKDVMEGWRKNEWFYCGVVISSAIGGTTIEKHAASLWGIECNYPAHGRNRNPNSYLTEVANELLPEAISTTQTAVCELAAKLGKLTR